MLRLFYEDKKSYRGINATIILIQKPRKKSLAQASSGSIQIKGEHWTPPPFSPPGEATLVNEEIKKDARDKTGGENYKKINNAFV
jgi:ribosomal protein S11